MLQLRSCMPQRLRGPDLVMPCQKIMALERSTEKSVLDPTVKMAEGTYKLVTPNVECVLSSDDSHLASRKYSLTATCNMINLPAFRLDPVRGKPQHALITITALFGDNLVVENLQLLDAGFAAQTKDSLKNCSSWQCTSMSVTKNAKSPGRSRLPQLRQRNAAYSDAVARTLPSSLQHSERKKPSRSLLPH